MGDTVSPMPTTPPQRHIARCMDGVIRHDAEGFDSLAEAQQWAQWGHACAAHHDYETRDATRVERINHALQANGLTWDSPIVDLIDALIYDGDFTADDADRIATRGITL